MDKEEESRSWDYKKIMLGVIVLGIIAVVGYSQWELILSYNTMPTKDVAGIETTQHIKNNQSRVTDPKIDLQEKIAEIAEEVSKLDVAEVTASSPQVQKVLKDMEALKNLPKNEAKDACMNICKSL